MHIDKLSKIKRNYTQIMRNKTEEKKLLLPIHN